MFQPALPTACNKHRSHQHETPETGVVSVAFSAFHSQRHAHVVLERPQLDEHQLRDFVSCLSQYSNGCRGSAI